MLNYLASSLSLATTPVARLLALQSVLRATSYGDVGLPVGLVRGMGERSPECAWQELVDSRFITPDVNLGMYVGRLTDPVGRMRGRVVRRRAADWALRTARPTRLRELNPGGRLLLVGLKAFTDDAGEGGLVNSAQMSRISGLTGRSLEDELKLLVSATVLATWQVDPDAEELVWRWT
ncbi:MULTISPECIES: hypothetical protein [Streptomyces]|uniref:hypothetical protein n=1 Tax=Streptomyces TaxID=1883 RepID=UPI001315C609|nr:hypothetical protein [Streptomyces sp. QHH-9511]QGZ47445.1 hypothetical protein GPZ77_02660 [Streptomyces sp. QHH-9511]